MHVKLLIASKLVAGIKPCMLELPTRTSSVFMCFVDIYPDENETCISLPQELYISTITGWTDPRLEPAIYQPMCDRYRNAWSVANGQYITELDVNKDDANVMCGLPKTSKHADMPTVQGPHRYSSCKAARDQSQI